MPDGVHDRAGDGGVGFPGERSLSLAACNTSDLGRGPAPLNARFRRRGFAILPRRKHRADIS